jgi:hypothetical protein
VASSPHDALLRPGAAGEYARRTAALLRVVKLSLSKKFV